MNDFLDAWLMSTRMEMAIRNPRAQVVISGVVDVAAPVNTGRLWTRHMAGVREAERDRRRYPRRELAVHGRPVTWGRDTLKSAWLPPIENLSDTVSDTSSGDVSDTTEGTP